MFDSPDEAAKPFGSLINKQGDFRHVVTKSVVIIGNNRASWNEFHNAFIIREKPLSDS
jgi:hypothetical protein